MRSLLCAATVLALSCASPRGLEAEACEDRPADEKTSLFACLDQATGCGASTLEC